MEPKLPTPDLSPEAANYHRQEVPIQPAGEQASTGGAEQQPSGGETREKQPGASGPADPAAVMQVPLAPALPPSVHGSTTTNAQDLTDGNPLVAADDELIEKEWIDKAKKIVNSTKDDPYLQEKEVSKLQADYISKRYGKTIKLMNEY